MNQVDRTVWVVPLTRWHCHKAVVAIMAAIPTQEEGLLVDSLGADLISTKISGYTLCRKIGIYTVN